MALIFNNRTISPMENITCNNATCTRVVVNGSSVPTTTVWEHVSSGYITINFPSEVSVSYSYGGVETECYSGSSTLIPTGVSVRFHINCTSVLCDKEFYTCSFPRIPTFPRVVDEGYGFTYDFTPQAGDTITIQHERLWKVVQSYRITTPAHNGSIKLQANTASGRLYYLDVTSKPIPIENDFLPLTSSVSKTELYMPENPRTLTYPLKLVLSNSIPSDYCKTNAAAQHSSDNVPASTWVKSYIQTIQIKESSLPINTSLNISNNATYPFCAVAELLNSSTTYKFTQNGITSSLTFNNDYGFSRMSGNVTIKAPSVYVNNTEYLTYTLGTLDIHTRTGPTKTIYISPGEVTHLTYAKHPISVQAYFKYSNGTAPAKLINNCPFPANVSYHTEKTNAGETGTNASRTLSANETYSFNLADRAWYSDNHMTAKLNYVTLDEGSYYPGTSTKNFEDKSGSGTTVNLI